MRYLITFWLCLGGMAWVNAQVSIYDCNLYNGGSLSQTDLGPALQDFYQPCITLDNTYSFGGTFNKKILANKSIDILPGFESGPYTANGMMDIELVPPKSDMDVAVMNYTALNSILRYEKLELGVAPPASVLTKINNFVTEAAVASNMKLNPFVEWEVRVQAVFNKVGTNVQEFVEGFYTREMVRNYATNSWDDAGTGYPFRIRFAPPQNGNWLCVVLMEILGDTEIYESDPFVFKVVESGNPGFAKVHANKKNLERGGEIIMPVGTNLPFDGGPNGEAYHHWTYDPDYVAHYPMNYWERYIHLVDSYGTEGGKFIRVMNDASNSEVEFEKLGNYYDRLKFAGEMDKLLDACHANGTMIDFCLMYHLPISKTGEAGKYAWDYGSYFPDTGPGLPADPMPRYCYAADFNSTEPMDMVYNPEAFKYIKQRYRYYISRYGYSTDIYMFDLINEPWHLGQDGSYEPYKKDATSYGDSIRAAVTKWQKDVSKYIKVNMSHKHHLLGVIGYPSSSFANVYSDVDYVEKTVNDLSWEDENIDLVCINIYSARPDRMIIDKGNPFFGNDNNGFYEDEQSVAYTVHQLHELYHKPVVFCELGHGGAVGTCSNMGGHAIDMMQYGFTGIAGFHHWEGWRYSGNGNYDERLLWKTAIRAQQHMNGSDVINTISNGNGNWLQGREVQKKGSLDFMVEQQYFRSYDKELAVGYVYNRTYNVKLLGCPNPNFDGTGGIFDLPRAFNWDNNKMHVQGLKNNTDYNVDWYSFKDGDYLYSQCINSSGQGELELRHPFLFPSSLLTPDEWELPALAINPILWYVIKQQNCEHGRSELQANNTEGTGNKNGSISEHVTNDSIYTRIGIENRLNVSPNPFTDEIHLSASDEIGEIIIRDSQGKIVVRETINTTLASISTTNLGQGMYFLSSKNWSLTFKIIKL